MKSLGSSVREKFIKVYFHVRASITLYIYIFANYPAINESILRRCN